MTARFAPEPAGHDLIAAIRRAARQEQFLEVVSAEEARARFSRHVDLSWLPGETVAVAAALGRVLARDVHAPIDVPPFDRANVDGFALRAADAVGATDAAPRRLHLNGEVIVCGHAPALEVTAGSATTIATGGVIPRGADAVVMIEHTELVDEPGAPAIDVRRPVAPGQFVSYAGSDIARGEALLRRGTRVSSREIGMLAACGIADVEVVRKPKVAVLSTGDELVAPGRPLGPAEVYDSNAAIIAAAVTEAGGEPVALGAVADDEAALALAMRGALESCDMVVLSGGTSKGAGDLSHRIVSKLGAPGILVHGVALKPGKPLCLAVIDGKPLAVLPGFPTSAIFTFHAFVAPVIRARAGLAQQAARAIQADVPVRIASELGRKEFVLVALVAGDAGPVAFPTAKGSGAVTSFSQADGFVEIDALAPALDAGTNACVTLIGETTAMPDLVVMGSHCIGLDVVLGALVQHGLSMRTIPVGSLGGVAAAERGECDLAPVHLVDPGTGIYNAHLLQPGLTLVKGWQRMQGLVHRPDDPRFGGRSAADALAAALADRHCLMVNRNAGAGTRVLIDRLLRGARPAGYSNQPRSHNAVAAAVAQGRADWGIAIESVARLYGLGFLPITPEDYDFLLVESRRDRPAVQAFLAALREEGVREKIRALGMFIRATLLQLCVIVGSVIMLFGPAQAQLRGHGGPVRALAISPDGGGAISGSFDSSVIRWSLQRNEAEQVLRFHDGAVNAVAILGGGRVASSGEDARIAIWRPGEQQPAMVLEGHQAPVVALAVSPDGTMLASASWDHTARLWPLAGGAPRVIEGHAQNVNGVAFTPDGRALVTVGYDATLCITPLVGDGSPTVVTLPTPLNSVAVAPDGEIAAVGADGKVYLVSAAGALVGEVEAGQTPVIAVASSPDGSRIAAAGVRGSVAIIERAARRLERTLVGPGLPVWSVAFFPDGRTLLTGGTDRMIRRWDVSSGEPIGHAVIGAPEDPLAAFAGDPGAEVFRACVACHTLQAGEGARAGPTLAGIFGRRIATLPGYNFSEALKRLDIVWTPETVSKLFEIGPMAYTPGTKMPEQKIGSAQDRAALVQFLEKTTTPN